MIIVSPKHISSPDVSVLIIAYNQEKTVSQTIESVLMQEGNFKMEIVITEDASVDNTPQICKDYQRNYLETIKLLLHERNQGIVKNYIDGLLQCRGKYIAQLASDDYWIDKQKLEKQKKFLETNPDFGVVSTGGYKLFVKTNKMVEGIPPLNPIPDGNVFPLTHKDGLYVMPLSLMFRRDLLKYIDFEQFILRKFSVEDVPIQAIFAKHTKYGHIPDLTCVYRVYPGSSTYTSLHNAKYIYYHEGLVAIKRYLAELYPGELIFPRNGQMII